LPLSSETQTARELFFEKGRPPTGWVPDVIERSWRRCAQHLDNAMAMPPNRIDSHVLEERRELYGQLRRAVQPEMDALAELVSASDSLVLLADAEGCILDAVGGLGFLRKAQQVYLQSGVLWSEEARGTNAIGTALVEGDPVLVRGRQHYLEANGILSCAAAPILSPQGELLAVLDVSGNSEHMHNQALGMVRLAIQIMEHRFALKTAESKSATLLRFHHQAELLGSHREGLLILDDTQIIGANRGALQLLGTDWRSLLGSCVDIWLDLPTPGAHGRSAKGSVSGEGAFHTLLDRCSPPRKTVSADFARVDDETYFDGETAAKLQKARRLLDAGIALLIHGETGTGKEVFARHLHALSRRSQGPFVAVNCAALPESLIESELFGYTKGAFTGACRQGMPGRVREADGGILFLDEIGDMPLGLQARLLRVLQERQVQPLGGGRAVNVDFALVCATNRNLAAMVETGAFRADLYYRIQDFTIRLPALRERGHLRELIHELMRRLGGDLMALDVDETALLALSEYPWPGNLRQLNSTLRTLIALSEYGDTLTREELPEEIKSHPRLRKNAHPAGHDLQSQTDKAIAEALAECDGCVSAAARRLGVHRSTLYRWMGRR